MFGEVVKGFVDVRICQICPADDPFDEVGVGGLDDEEFVFGEGAAGLHGDRAGDIGGGDCLFEFGSEEGFL